MRALLVLLGIVVLVAAGLIVTGWIPVWQTRPAVVQAPEFKAALPEVSMGTRTEQVTVPTVNVRKPGESPTPAPAQ